MRKWVDQRGRRYAESGQISQTREEESEQNSRRKENLASEAHKAHTEMCEKAMVMMNKIEKVLQKFESEDETDWNKKRASRKLNIGFRLGL